MSIPEEDRIGHSREFYGLDDGMIFHIQLTVSSRERNKKINHTCVDDG